MNRIIVSYIPKFIWRYLYRLGKLVQTTYHFITMHVNTKIGFDEAQPTSAFLERRFSLGILTFFKYRKPLSIVGNPSFVPMSPTDTPEMFKRF